MLIKSSEDGDFLKLFFSGERKELGMADVDLQQSQTQSQLLGNFLLLIIDLNTFSDCLCCDSSELCD